MTADTPKSSDLPVRIRPEIASLPAYKQGKQAASDAYKLSSNENPFDPLPSVVAALNTRTGVNRYPDASAAALRAALAARFGVTEDGVHIAAGSVSILQQLALATSSVGDEIIFAWRSFEAYPGLAVVAGAKPVAVPLTTDGRHDLDAMAAAVTDRTRMIIVCTPNNPTGPAILQDEFEAFLDAIPSDILVILDEAYIEFVTDPAAVDGLGSAIHARRPNVVVLRTFSKAYGLAGLRIGYAVGHPRVLDAARSTGIPLSVTGSAEAAALASLDAEVELRERVEHIVNRRTRLVEGLRDAGWRVPDAQGNFVWLGTGADSAAAAVAFDEAGLIVRQYGDEGVRVSVGEDESVDKVLAVAASIVQTLPNSHPARA